MPKQKKISVLHTAFEDGNDADDGGLEFEELMPTLLRHPVI
jgi:proline dehydrogenase